MNGPGRKQDSVARFADSLPPIPLEVQPAPDHDQDLVHRMSVGGVDLASRVMLQLDAALFRKQRQKVWIDGALMFDSSDPKRRPVSDFELGQPGEGDVK